MRRRMMGLAEVQHSQGAVGAIHADLIPTVVMPSMIDVVSPIPAVTGTCGIEWTSGVGPAVKKVGHWICSGLSRLGRPQRIQTEYRFTVWKMAG